MTDASLEILFLLRSLSSKEQNFGVGPHFFDFFGVSTAILKISPTESLMKSLDRGPGIFLEGRFDLRCVPSTGLLLARCLLKFNTLRTNVPGEKRFLGQAQN